MLKHAWEHLCSLTHRCPWLYLSCEYSIIYPRVHGRALCMGICMGGDRGGAWAVGLAGAGKALSGSCANEDVWASFMDTTAGSACRKRVHELHHPICSACSLRVAHVLAVQAYASSAALIHVSTHWTLSRLC